MARHASEFRISRFGSIVLIATAAFSSYYPEKKTASTFNFRPINEIKGGEKWFVCNQTELNELSDFYHDA